MKFEYLFKREEKELSIRMISENQKESAEIIQIANRIAAPVYSYGRVDEENTWVWINIPLKYVEYWIDYFGTRRK